MRDWKQRFFVAARPVLGSSELATRRRQFAIASPTTTGWGAGRQRAPQPPTAGWRFATCSPPPRRQTPLWPGLALQQPRSCRPIPCRIPSRSRGSQSCPRIPQEPGRKGRNFLTPARRLRGRLRRDSAASACTGCCTGRRDSAAPQGSATPPPPPVLSAASSRTRRCSFDWKGSCPSGPRPRPIAAPVSAAARITCLALPSCSGYGARQLRT